MNNAPSLVPRTTGMTIDGVYYAIFRHKWKILTSTAAGLLVALSLYVFNPPPFQSEALLFIRYVMENSAPGLPGNDSKAISPDQRGETILATEAEILGSLDIAYQVADAVGPEKILSKERGPKDRDRAAVMIRKNLIILPLPKSSVIKLVFQSADPAIVQPVLTAVIDAYLKKHVEVHRGIEVAGDFLSQETDQLRSRLSQTEDDLRKTKDKAGIMSLDDTTKAYTEQVARIQQDIFSAEAELAERSATLQALDKSAPAPPRSAGAPGASAPELPAAQLDAYRDLRARLDRLQKTEQQLLAQFTDKNQRVVDVRAQIADAESQRQKLEEKYPTLARVGAPAAVPANGSIDLATQSALLVGLQSKITILNSELAQVRSEEKNVGQLEGPITELQRQRDLEEANYRYYSVHLEAARIDEALGAGRAYNIATIQTPTPPRTDWIKTWETLGTIAIGGLVLGVAWALLIESYFDHTVRRPADIERDMRIPLFLSIPDFGRNGHNRHIFHETLRDRLIGYFESKNLTHKPKLVAVTGVAHRAGVTSTAAGLAQCLSETGEGNVLLVDMTLGQGSAQQFYKGSAVCGLDELLDTRTTAQVQSNLYVVGEEPNSDKLSRALPNRFRELVPKLKASDFDYIIFDMPVINQISITPRLAGFMDMVLLVVESEQTDKDIVRQAVALLAESRAHVGAVLNKTRNYLPSKTHHEFLGSA